MLTIKKIFLLTITILFFVSPSYSTTDYSSSESSISFTAEPSVFLDGNGVNTAGFFTGVFGNEIGGVNTVQSGDVYTFPTDAAAYGGFTDNNFNLYPITFNGFLNGSPQITFCASSDSVANIVFRLENNPYPANDTIKDSVHIEIPGDGVMNAYTAPINLSGPVQNWNSFLMFIEERDVPVTIGKIKGNWNGNDSPDISGYCDDFTPNTVGNNSAESPAPKQIVNVKGYPEAMPGESVDVTIEYNTSDDNPNLIGLGLRIHYDSSVLQFNRFVGSFAQDLLSYSEPFDDVEDYDGNTKTDRYIQVGWAAFWASWPGVSLPTELLTLNFNVGEEAYDLTPITFSSQSTSIGYLFAPTTYEMPITNGSLDFDKNGKVDALTDGILLLRYLLNIRGSALTYGTIAVDSPLTPMEVEFSIEYQYSTTDIDGNGISDALTDGLLLLRYLFDGREDALVAGAVASGATSSEIEQYIAKFIPSDNSESNDNSEPVTNPPYLVFPETALNFSASSTAAGYAFDSINCVVSAVAYESIGCEQASPSAGTQSIYVTNIHRADNQLIVTVGYESNNSTTGIGFRLHYDSDALSFADVTTNSNYPVALDGYQSDDFEDADNDPSTDQKLSFGIVDILGSSFPSTLSDLATITFEINPGPWPIDENIGAGNIVYQVTANDFVGIGSDITFSLNGNDASSFTINGQSGEVTLLDNPDYEAQPEYNFSVIATDLAGNSSQITVNFTVNNLDEVAPFFTSSETATINENVGADVVIYTATANDTNDISDGFFFSLEAGSDAALSIDPYTGEITLTNNPDYEQQSFYTFTLMVTDTVGFTDELIVNLNVNNLDEVAPNIYVDSYIASIEENSGAGQVISQCTADDSADISGGVTFSLAEYSYLSINSNSCEVTLLNNPDYESLSVLNYAVIATDAAGNARTHNATLNIINLDDTAPIFTSDNYAESIDENSGAGQVVYTATADDSDDVSNGVTFSLVEGSDPALTIDATIGQVVLNNNPDYESQSEYNFTVVATDAAGNSIEQTMVLDVSNLDEVSPTFTSSSYANPIEENSGAGQVIYTAVADDSADISDGITFSLNNDSDLALTINASSGNVTLNNDPDHETQNQYSFAIIATDMASNTSDTKYVTLDINNLDDTAPIITSTSTIAIDENNGYEQIVYTATADDSADVSDGVTFSLVIGSDPALTIDVITGEVVLYNDPDYESQSEYNFTVVATDVAGNSSEQTIVLDVNNLDESAPTITSTAIASAINENSGYGQVVYTTTADDSADISDGVIFNLAEGSDSALTINAASGEVVLINNPDHETQSLYSFAVFATDMAGNLSTSRSVSLVINDLDESAPTITSSSTATAINENSGAGQVVYIATADDSADISQGIYFSLGGNDAEVFAINGETGVVNLLVDPDFESQSAYNFTVNAIDNAGNSSSKGISLQINDLEEDPVADLGTQNISVTNTPKGILGRTFVLEVSYDTTDNNSQLSGLGMRVHFDSSLLSFKKITGLIQQDIIIDGQGPYSDDADSDNDPLTDQYIMFGWASLLNNWPNVELPTVLMNISFDVSNTIDTDALSSTSINFTDSAFTAGYGFNAESYELGLLKATWDFDGNGEADALTDGLMMLRYLFGLRGDAVTNNAIANNSPLSKIEVIAEIEASLVIADIDADGKLNALTDGLLLLRYLFAMRDDSLTYGAIGPDANRTSNEQIEYYIESFLPTM